MINCSKLICRGHAMKKSKILVLGAMIAVASVAAPSVHAANLAKVNGKVITDRDLESALSNLNDGQRSTALKDSNTRRQVLGGVIDQEVLVQEAEKQKLDADQ